MGYISLYRYSQIILAAGDRDINRLGHMSDEEMDFYNSIVKDIKKNDKLKEKVVYDLPFDFE